MKNQGFTLVELIIYVAILATILVLITSFLWLIVLGNIKETAYQEVQQNGRFAIMKITQEIKKANGINNPLAGDPPSASLSLKMADPNLNPTIFDVVDGKLRISQGTNPSYYLTTDQVIVSNLQFTNLSYENTPGTIQIEMTIDHINPGNRTEYQASVNLTSSVSLVPGGAAAPPPVAYCSGTCTPCSDILDKATCEAQDGCSWSGRLKKCFDNPGCTSCDSYTTEPECIAQSGCQWIIE